ncbi:hypothetical protein [Ornithinibacillus halotolerans]|uniref:Lipoprotein n=1 Tax=Ornithinibacillus halotolerans TaxID=1274357 RepID=A0A916W4T3_9BACI|nr:hypothetical protein [Ornithinibacillus halotolerans]GGA67943.1 hypothetical protein GCM10008025_09770 [Ornithinibacillus halotolerans]
MKKIVLFVFMVLVLIGCSGSYKNLVQIDVHTADEDRNYSKLISITDIETLESIKNILEEIIWDPHIDPEMARYEDITMILTFEDANGEELEYKIWFNQGGTANFISSNDKEGYGGLITTEADKLKEILRTVSGSEIDF